MQSVSHWQLAVLPQYLQLLIAALSLKQNIALENIRIKLGLQKYYVILGKMLKVQVALHAVSLKIP